MLARVVCCSSCAQDVQTERSRLKREIGATTAEMSLVENGGGDLSGLSAAAS